jgi:hypothetical protein
MVRTLRGSKQPSRPAGPIRCVRGWKAAIWWRSGRLCGCGLGGRHGQLLESAVTPSQGYALVTLGGDVDVDTAEQLWQYLSYLIGQGHHHIVLGLAGMVLIDSAGVSVLTRPPQ